MRLMSILILLFAFAIGYATFIENDFGRTSAKALIFNTWWFEMILVLLTYNLINNVIKHKLFRMEKIASLTFHLSFIIILIGAGITRYISYEGMMHIREGESTNQFISDDTFFQIHINDKLHQLNHDEKLYLSGITNSNFSLKLDFKDHDIKIEGIDFLPNVKDSLFTNVAGGNDMLHIVVPGEDGMQSEYLNDKVQRVIKGEVFTFNNPMEGAINLSSAIEGVFCNSPYDVETMNMDTRATKEFDYLSDFMLNRRTLHTANGLNFVLKEVLENAKMIPISPSNVMNDGAEDALIVKINADGEEKLITLYGGKGYQGDNEVFAINDLNFKLSYGSKYYSVPFQVKLRDFQLDRYAGSMSPSSYAAEISILENDTEAEHRIFMNNVLQHGGFRLFQSSYDKDEKGTILSVNHDWWGTLVTYIGYALMALGMLLVFLTKKTRFNSLTQKLKKLKNKAVILFIPLFFSISVQADEVINAEHAARFESLVVQDNGGRLKPAHTLCSEFLRKIYGKDRFIDLSATQVILGMMNDPVTWSKNDLVKVSHPTVRTLLGSTDTKSKYIRTSFNSFFEENGHYVLAKLVEDAYEKLPAKRSEYEKEIIKVDERVNICFTVFSGGIFRFFPLANDSNNTWLSYTEHSKFSDNDSLFVANIIPMYFRSVTSALKDSSWAAADSIVNYISRFQNRYGAEVMPEESKVKLEITYNKLGLFSKLFMYYSMVGLVLLILLIVQLFKNTKFVRILVTAFKWLIILGFLAHTSGLIMRWIISGHAPWSNGYESMIYIAWATIFAGLIFSRRSLLSLAATAIVSAMLLMVAHLNWLDPEITNLVPVLKSYWLMIHVAIIVASYGFLALAAILGFISLLLIIFTNKMNKVKLKDTLTELTIINEKSIEVGLFMLTIGTFLGGVWANESWGRYWGWDPKETWALASVLVYVFVLHMRFIPGLKGKYVFNVASLVAIWSIIMTYFGVNYYLSGLHSYAAGDPMPIPVFVYYLVAVTIITAIIAKFNYKKHY
ncbi:MAG: Cytochrome c biogenesis protein CcsA [Cryomorphaceae bacterium]|nr:MAG: Cytochrome c biogenesis protein CcsA [Cryomorphaceae bacterium]